MDENARGYVADMGVARFYGKARRRDPDDRALKVLRCSFGERRDEHNP